MIGRRFFLLAAPAIVAAPSLMRVSTLFMPPKPITFHGIPLVFDETVIGGVFAEYTGYDSVDIRPEDVFSLAEFDWKMAALIVRG